MGNSQYERDFNEQSALKRPGRLDFRTLNNINDVGDGYPGLQKCYRNYLHEGGMEKDLDLVGYGIIGTSVNIDNAELQQLSNIESVTISGDQWGYVGGANQPVKQADLPTFGGITVNGNIIITGNVDDVDIALLKTNFDTHKASTGADHTYINQSVVTTASPTFVGLTLSADLVTNSTIDGVDVSAIKLNSMPSVADGDINVNAQKIISLGEPTADSDAARRQDVGIGNPSEISQHSNDILRSSQSASYEKMKEVIVYRNLKNFTVKWEFREQYGSFYVQTKIYINGSPIGTEKETNSGTFVTVSDDISNIYSGDMIQIYGKKTEGGTVQVQYMEIRYDYFENTL